MFEMPLADLIWYVSKYFDLGKYLLLEGNIELSVSVAIR